MLHNNIDTVEWEHAIVLTKELIGINSSVPEGKGKILEHVADMLHGIDTEIVKPAGIDPYLIATVGPDSECHSFRLILEGHLDTVPPGTMENPFQPVERQDKLYGRGASDMKGGCAAMLYALKKFAELPEIAGQVQLVLCTDEETASKGIVHALTNRVLRADLAVVGEPTQLAMGIAHKGIEWIEVLFNGRSGHASRPELGLNAIEMAGRFIVAVVEYNRHHFPGRSHPVCGLPTMNIGTIRGGELFPNIVPELCSIKLDRRWNPNEKIEDIWNDIEACLSQCKKEQSGFDGSWRRIGVDEGGIYPPLYFPKENPIFSLISAVLQEAGLPVESRSLSYWTEGSLLQKYGIPSLIFGPGNINQAHSAHDYVEINQIARAAQCYFAIMTKTCLLESLK